MPNISEAETRIAQALQSGRTELDLQGLGLTGFPPNFTQIAPKLTALDLSNNDFQSLPRQIGLCSKLETLNMQWNKLRTGYGFASLPSLRHLNLQENLFFDFPNELLEIPALERLSIDHNSLSRLPGGIRLLRNLKFLDVRGNQLESLPPEIADMSALEELLLAGNPLKTPPLEIAARGVPAIRAYFDDLTRNEQRVEGKNYLLAVAIENYAHTQSPRPGCVSEAQDLVGVLREKYGYQEVRMLFDQQATRAAVRAALSDLTQQTGPQDSVIFYFNGWTGDGRSESDLFCYDVPGFLGFEEVANFLASMRARQVLVVVDNHLQSSRMGQMRGTRASGSSIASRWAFYRVGADWEMRFTPRLTNWLRSISLDVSAIELASEISGASAIALSITGDEGGEFFFSPKKEEMQASEPPAAAQNDPFITLMLEIGQLEKQIAGETSPEKRRELQARFEILTAESIELREQLTGVGQEKTEEIENIEWNKAVAAENPGAFESYLQKFPNGLFASEAQKRLEELKAQEREEAIFAVLKANPNFNEALNFLTFLPAGKHRAEVLAMIDDFEKSEETLWQSALAKNTIEAIQQYQQKSKILKYSAAALERLAQLQSTTGRLVREAKLIIVGNGRVGKTSLSKVLRGLPFDPAEKSTHGIYIEPWLMQTPDKQPITLNIWDFGGQEIYHGTHSFFLTKRALYLLVWSTESLRDAREHPERDDRERNFEHEYWLDMVKNRSDGSPVLMVQNRFGGEGAEPLDQMKYAVPFNVRDFQNVDAQACLPAEIALLRERLARQFADAPALRELIPFRMPDSWWTVRQALEKRRSEDRYISLEKYQEICAAEHISDPTEFGIYLHNIGSVLYFPEDEKTGHNLLNEIVVLDPVWATELTYRILNQQVKDDGGRFRRSDLKVNWDKKMSAEFAPGFRFKAEKEIEIFLLLMRSFDICFELPGEPGTFVAPQFLPAGKPDFQWESKRCRRIGWQFNFLPRNVIARAIAKMGGRAEGGIFWREGIVVAHKNTRAKIETDPLRNLLRVEITGEKPDSMEEWVSENVALLADKLPNTPVCFCPECDAPMAISRLEKPRGMGETKIFCPGCEQNVLISKVLKSGLAEKDMVPKFFISYADEDHLAKNEFVKWLETLNWKDKIRVWDESQIPPGAEREQVIRSNFADSEIIVLLLTNNYMASDYIKNVEFEQAMRRHERGEAIIIPLLVNHCMWEITAISKLQPLPENGNPLADADKPAKVWKEVVLKIAGLLKAKFGWGA